MVIFGWVIIALSGIAFYRFGQAIQSDNEKKRSQAWLILIVGLCAILNGVRLISYASRTSYQSTPSPSAYSGATFTMTDPRTGQQRTVPLTNEDMKDFQSNPTAVVTKKSVGAWPPP